LDANSIEQKKSGSQKLEDWLVEKGKEGFYIGTSDSKVKRLVPNYLEIRASSLKIF
jgi:hypothetical protein